MSWDDTHLPLIGLDPAFYPADPVRCQGATCGGRSPTDRTCPVYDCDYGRTEDKSFCHRLNSTQRYKRRVQRFRAKQEQEWQRVDQKFRDYVANRDLSKACEGDATLSGPWAADKQTSNTDNRNTRPREVSWGENVIIGSPTNTQRRKQNTALTDTRTLRHPDTHVNKQGGIHVNTGTHKPAWTHREVQFPQFCFLPDVQLSTSAQSRLEEERKQADKLRLLREEERKQQQRTRVRCTPISNDCKDAPWSTQVMRHRETHQHPLHGAGCYTVPVWVERRFNLQRTQSVNKIDERRNNVARSRSGCATDDTYNQTKKNQELPRAEFGHPMSTFTNYTPYRHRLRPLKRHLTDGHAWPLTNPWHGV